MSHFRVNERDIYFILKEQLGYDSLCKLDRYRDLDVETLDMVVSEAVKFAKGVVGPLQEAGDRHGVIYAEGRFVVHQASGRPLTFVAKMVGLQPPAIRSTGDKASLACWA